MDEMDKRLFTYQELAEHGERCVNYVLQGATRYFVFSCISTAAVVFGTKAFLDIIRR